MKILELVRRMAACWSALKGGTCDKSHYLSTQQINEMKAKAVIDFVDSQVGAVASGFTDPSSLTLSGLYQYARHYIRDNYRQYAAPIDEKWGEDTARDCGLNLDA